MKGFEGDDLKSPLSIAATAKHLAAYGASVAGRDYAQVEVSERSLHEVYLSPFKAAVAAGIASLMPAFTDLDNIPLTALALKQGGYDWGYLAFTVGFGGSMIWFGSSAGVALTNLYPEARSVWQWVRHGWFVAVAYVVAFFAMLTLWPWHSDAPHKDIGTEMAAPR